MVNILFLNFLYIMKEDFWYKGYWFLKGLVMFFMIDFVLIDFEIFFELLRFNFERFIDINGKCLGE